MRTFILFFCLLLILPLTGCTIYQADVQQGNEINIESVETLTIGMSKRDVTKILGQPLITDPFHVDRWDYYYYLKRGSTGEQQQHSLTLIFGDDRLIKIDKRLQ